MSNSSASIRYRLVAAGLLMPLISGLVGCVGESDEVQFTVPIRPAKIIEISDPTDELERVFPGTVVSADNTVLSFRVGGRLVELPIDQRVGGLVAAGDLLAALDDTDYGNALADAEANFDLARAQFKRAGQLVEKGYISETEFDRLRARYKGRDAALKQARTNMAYTKLHAPFDGRIARLMVRNFESVKADVPVAILEGADSIDVQVQVPTSFMSQVPEQFRAKYRSGIRGLQMFEIEFKSQPGVRHAGSVIEVETKPDPATLSYRVIVSMPAPEGLGVLPGMHAKVHLNLARMEVLNPQIRLPVEALFSADEQALEEGAASVWVVEQDTMRVRRREVTIGDITPFGITIEEGLEPGEMIVAAGVHFLTEGTQVRALTREGGL